MPIYILDPSVINALDVVISTNFDESGGRSILLDSIIFSIIVISLCRLS